MPLSVSEGGEEGLYGLVDVRAAQEFPEGEPEDETDQTSGERIHHDRSEEGEEGRGTTATLPGGGVRQP